MKRISMFMVLAFVLTAMVAGANPFSDVPFSHWAYDAVNKLAAKGLIQGYPDGTYKGEKHVTRYALAMVTAKMLANVEQMLEKGIGTNLVTKSDLQTLEKLTVEFADELALLGVKVTALEDDMQVVKEDVSTLKKDVEGIKDYMAKGGMEKVKLSGDMLVRHSNLIHARDWNNGTLAIGNNNNSQTQSQLRFQFKANIDENITAVARWSMLDKIDSKLGTANNGTAFGNHGIYATVNGANTIDASADTSHMIDLAYLHIKDMFRFGGDFTFGRNFYATGHSLLLSDYVDALKYYKRSGDIDVALYTIYDRHVGSYNDGVLVPGAAGNYGTYCPTDFRNIWGLTLGTKYHDHDLYLNFFGQADPNLINRRFGAVVATTLSNVTPTAANGNPINQSKDALMALEFGGKGPLGRNGHWDYDLGLAYTGYKANIVQGSTANVNNYSDVSMDGWAGTMAIKWDSKKEWAAKLGYTFGTDESVGGLALNNDRRYDDGIETPYEDISRGNNYFNMGLVNMYDVKLQVEFRPRNTKHYFRLAGDFLDEMKDTVSNDLSRLCYGNNFPGLADVVGAGQTKNNTVYDKWNNFGTSSPKATVFTFEYRYQLAENTRIRLGYTMFDMTGSADRSGWTPMSVLGGGIAAPTYGGNKAGRNFLGAGDYDFSTVWAEIYSRF